MFWKIIQVWFTTFAALLYTKNINNKMKNISVIGAGTMGNGIAHVFAMNGFQVNLVDLSQEVLDKAIKTIDKNLSRMVAKERGIR